MSNPEYSPIEVSGEFRLITIKSALLFEDNIICTLRHALIGRRPSYEALSYVWGDPKDLVPIQLGQAQIRVTRNLEAALRQLRYRHRDREIWVDALCIDQKNNAEKSIQVRFMTNIYKHCTRVILWLGLDAKELKAAQGAMQHFECITRMNIPKGGLLPVDADKLPRDQEHERYFMGRDLETFFDGLSIWKRAWVVQELSFSPEILLVAGDIMMEWKVIEDFLEADRSIELFGIPDAFHGQFNHDWSLEQWISVFLARPMAICHQRAVIHKGNENNNNEEEEEEEEVEKREEEKEPQLLDILARFNYTEATDPRDHIYALFGFFPGNADITVDYSSSVRRIFTDIMIKLIKDNQNLDPLVQCAWQLHGNEDRRDDLPSWVIDFAHPGEAQILFARRSIFNASGSYSLLFPLTFTENDSLKLSGFKLDIVSVVRTFEEWEQRYDSYMRWGYLTKICLLWMPDHLIKACIEKTGNYTLSRLLKGDEIFDQVYPNFEVDFKRYWRTLLLDITDRPTRRLNSDDYTELLPTLMLFIETALNSRGYGASRTHNSYDRNMFITNTIDNAVYKLFSWDFAVTKGGRYCRTAHGTKSGDWIVVLKGAKVPVVLRPRVSLNNQGGFEFIGACYVDGFMDGEGVTSRKFEERSFIIV